MASSFVIAALAAAETDAIAKTALLIVIDQRAKTWQSYLRVELTERLDGDGPDIGTPVVQCVHQRRNRELASDLTQRPNHFVI